MSPRIRDFFQGAGFPIFLISASACYELFLLAIVFLPGGTSAWGGFVDEFRQWCFNYDPRTGTMEWAQVVVMLIEPPSIAAIAVFLWRRSLGELGTRSRRKGLGRAALSGAAVTGLAVCGLFLYGLQDLSESSETLPFPGERIRTSIRPPEFHFEDQKGELFSLEDTRGQVTLVTGIYAACSTSCPEILIATKEWLDSLPEEIRRKVAIVALSLNPEYDTKSLMDRVATGYGFEYPQFRYVNGDAESMFGTLARFGFSRSVDRETGIVNHSNLFVFLDARGTIAYRFGLDADRQHWLRQATLALAAEADELAMLAETRR